MAVKRLVALALCAAGHAVGCGGDPAQVRLVPRFGACPKPSGSRTLLVTPLGDFRADRRAIDSAVALADLPGATEQLAVEVVGPGGAIVAAGKTARFDFDQLADGAELPIAMAPPDGFCELASMTAARDRPLVARTGDGVLIAGGYGAGGAPLASAEYFDPATDSFRPVALPAGFLGVRGLAGAALVALPAGRVALVGGPSPGFAIYEPATGFAPAAVLITQVRAHAAAVALDATHVLLAGGCSQLDDTGACVSAARDDSMILDLASGAIEPGPALAAPRRGGQAFAEVGPDGVRRVVIVGGVDDGGQPITTAERLDLGSPAITLLPGAGATAAALDSGTLVTGFAADGATAAGTSAAIVPGVDVARPLRTAASRAGVALVTEEDGHVLALGGGGPPLRFLPATGVWRPVAAATEAPALAGGHAAVVLGDGSVLIVGGRDGGGPDARAWRFRPSLLGPLTGSLTIVPADDQSAPPLAPLDFAQVEAAGNGGPAWRLRGSGGAAPSWAVVGGPVAADLRVELAAAVPAEGIAVLIGFVDAGTHHRAVLIPGEPAALERRAAGVATTVCRGGVVPAPIDAAITVEVRAGTVRVAAGGQVVLSCDAPALARGRVGVAALGDGVVGIETIAVNR